MDEESLRAKARSVVRQGKLPRRNPDRTWGGPGVGATCAVCDLPVTKNEMEFEIQFSHDGGNPGLDKFHVHVRCFAAWEFERQTAWDNRELEAPVVCSRCGDGIATHGDLVITKADHPMHKACAG
jgi:hypothetical protein